MDYTEEEFIQLEEDERSLTNEYIAAMLLILANTKGDLENEIRRFYQKYGKDGVITYAEARKWVSEEDHRRRLTALLMFLTATMSSTQLKLKREFEKMLTSVIGKESGHFTVNINPDEILKLTWGSDDKNWLERLEDDVDTWNVNIAADCKRSILQRKSLDDVLDKLDKRFNTIESITNSLGLTESTAIGSMAREKAFKELGIKKYQFYTRVDERRCETCGAMHGLIFPISAYEVGVTASPLHPHCRCWEVPILE